MRFFKIYQGMCVHLRYIFKIYVLLLNTFKYSQNKIEIKIIKNYMTNKILHILLFYV